MASPTKAPTARQFFARTGYLSQWHPQFEFRPGQLAMAEAVEAAIADKQHLIVEAGTGTGKTLAYLIPAILAGRRVVVSTGTKNLQDQLFYKDLPFLQQHFPMPLSVAYMKGRNNYLCRQKVYDAEREPILNGLEEIADFQIIREWEKTTPTGDRAEIKTLPEDSTVWAKLDARRELCSGNKCPQFERCFVTQMHQKAHESDVIIVNHHLFFADLAVKKDDFASIIPEYAAVIFDEAHEIEDVAGQYFGVSISSYQFLELRRDILLLVRRKNINVPGLDEAMLTLEDRSEGFFDLFGLAEGRVGFTGHADLLKNNGDEYRALLLTLELVGGFLQLIKDETDEVIPLYRRTQELAENLKFWMESGEGSFVYYVDRRGRGTYLHATPIDVSALLQHRLFGDIDSVILTSATLAVAGTFDFAEKRLGLLGARQLIVPGHFDYQEQALLYVPQQLPDPRSAAFSDAAVREIVRLLEITEGRAFVLFTSYAQMRQVYNKVTLRIPHPTLLQGTGPRSALLEEFRNTPNCVLFATSSFWQGVDVPGDQLSCVIIDRLPFAVPNDPVVAARGEAVKAQGGNPFYDFQIPQAALTLKQGFGRLIRSRADRGVLVLLDNRITKQRYGQVFFDSLPDYAFTIDIQDVEKFFNV